MPQQKQMSRFPAARIKKILQADEDVGRVNQATPAVIGTAVELFLETLMKAAVAALPDGVTILTPTHLKRCIEQSAKFDYLRDIVAEVREAADVDQAGPAKKKATATKRKAEDAPKAQRQPKKATTVKTEHTALDAGPATKPHASMDDDPFGLSMAADDVDLGVATAQDSVAAVAPVAEDMFAGLGAGAGAAASGHDGKSDDDDDDYD